MASHMFKNLRILNISNGKLVFYRRMNSLTATKKEPQVEDTAGIIIIGDEVLKGQVHDVNTHFISKNLYKLGVRVARVSIIPDDIDVIAKEVSIFSKKFKYVITAGGIGPTHDDVTYEGIAKAFNQKVKPHPELVSLCKEYFKTDDMDSPAMKLAKIPESSILKYSKQPANPRSVISRIPIVLVNNVYVFPGVPVLLERAFKNMGNALFQSSSCTFHTHWVYLCKDEVSIAPYLNRVVAKHPDVIFGSYPVFFHSYYQVRITIESRLKEKAVQAYNDILEEIPKEYVISNYDEHPEHDSLKKIMNLSHLTSLVNDSLQVIQSSFEEHKLDEICISFNGGKDSVVMLHLCYAVLQKIHPKASLQAFYVRDKNSFPELDTFVEESVKRYNLHLTALNAPMKSALMKLKHDNPKLNTVFIGVRSSDPIGKSLSPFVKTDPDWPEFLRVHPLLAWDYKDIWSFIRELNLHYCTLYDRGYTSLGNVQNTLPNTLLQFKDNLDQIKFKPAYLLKDGSGERNGRVPMSKI